MGIDEGENSDSGHSLMPFGRNGRGGALRRLEWPDAIRRQLALGRGAFDGRRQLADRRC